MLRFRTALTDRVYFGAKRSINDSRTPSIPTTRVKYSRACSPMSHIIDILFAPEIVAGYYTKSLEDSQDLSPPRSEPMRKRLPGRPCEKRAVESIGP
jgi:hypothetical protein